MPYAATRRTHALAPTFLAACAFALATSARPAGAQVAATTPESLAVYSTITSAGFEWWIGGDDNGNCVVTLEYRRVDSPTWKPAQPLLRVEHGLWTHGEDPGNLLAGSLFFLEPGRSYEARLTLADPDGGAAQRIVAFATRSEPVASARRTLYVVPGSGGGTGTQADPFHGLAAADAAARAGDLFLLQPGTYHGNFTPAHDGTATDPIVWRGAAQASVILDGDGGTASTSHCVTLTNRRYVFVEQMSLVDCLRPVSLAGGVGIVIRGCLVQPIDQLLSTHGIEAALSRDCVIEDNTVLMPGQWATIGRTGTYGTGGYGILIEGTGHVIAHNRVVEAWDAISIPATDTAVPACVTSNVDIDDNDIDRASDDGIQADATHHNIRIFRNRLLNTGSAVSFQPCFGGPGYVLDNEIFNNRIEPYKFHQETSYGWTQETSGFVVMHNTSVCSRNAWYESGIWRHGTFRDNLAIGARASTPSLYAGYALPGASFDADGWNRVGGYATLVRFAGTSYANLPAFATATGNEAHGVELSPAALVNAPFPHDPSWEYTNGYGAAYTPADYDLRPVAGGGAIDKGLPLANVDDAFAGRAPDLGCYEYGAAVPAYGPRPGGAPILAVPPASAPALALAAAPNPFGAATMLGFALAAPAHVTLDVLDVQGRRVRSLRVGPLAAGPHAEAWDGRGEAGRPLPPGLYFARLLAGERVAVVRLVVAR